jgi:TusE/DsrC/DsvC family sulfur relay protein
MEPQMDSIKIKDKTYDVDEFGFLRNPDDWDEDFAIGIAGSLQIKGLSDEHWKIINFTRTRYEKTNTCPVIYDTCKYYNISLSKLKTLFPTGYQRGACKLAGITYLDGFLNYHYLDKVLNKDKPYSEDKTYLVSAMGFLIDPAEWDESFAVNKAIELKMPNVLTEKHWEIIYYLRDNFEKYNNIPTVFEAVEDNNIDLADLETLFPDGYHRGAVKLAGLRIR